MKIRIGIVDTDTKYITKLENDINTKHSDKIETYTFNSIDKLKSFLEKDKLDVTLVDENLHLDDRDISRKIIQIYLVEEKTNSKRIEIEKYQREDIICNEIIDKYFQQRKNIIHQINEKMGKTKVIAITSPAGGSGASMIAMAAAKYLSVRGKKTFYLNAEQFGNYAYYYGEDDNNNFSNVLEAIKRSDVDIKDVMVKTIKVDREGTDFFPKSPKVEDTLDIEIDIIQKLLVNLAAFEKYEYIIIDMNSTIDHKYIKFMDGFVTNLVIVNTGSENSNFKCEKLFEVLRNAEKREYVILTEKVKVMYNRFADRFSKKIAHEDIETLGVINEFLNCSQGQVMDGLLKNNIFDFLLK